MAKMQKVKKNTSSDQIKKSDKFDDESKFALDKKDVTKRKPKRKGK